MIKGFALDDKRLKQGSNLIGKDFFQELLERVRSIRSSERRIWQKKPIFSLRSTLIILVIAKSQKFLFEHSK